MTLESRKEQHNSCIALIGRLRERPIGVGFLVDQNNIVTASHTVWRATISQREYEQHPKMPGDMSKPCEQFSLNFPFADIEVSRKASIIFWGPEQVANNTKMRQTSSRMAHHIAVLQLDEKSGLHEAGVVPAQLTACTEKDTKYHQFTVYGYPDECEKARGDWAQGTIGRFLPSRKLKVEFKSESGILPGFCGAPVLDETLNRVIGMLAEVTKDRKSAYVIPNKALCEILKNMHRSAGFYEDSLKQAQRRMSVSIDPPNTHVQVGQEITITGKAEDIPSNVSLLPMLYIKKANGDVIDLTFPQGPPITVDKDGKWAATFSVGRKGDKDMEFLIQIVSVGPCEKTRYKQYFKKASETGQFVGLEPPKKEDVVTEREERL